MKLDDREVQEVASSEREGVKLYKHGDSVAVTTQSVQDGDAEAVHITYDELMNLLVDARPHFRGEPDDG